MASVSVNQLSLSDKSTLACTYACLLLHDEGLDIEAKSIKKLLDAANVKYEAFWPTIFEKTLKGRNISDLIVSGGSSQGEVSTAQASEAKDTKKSAGKTEEKKPEKKEEKKQEEPAPAEEVDMGGLFDF